MRLSASALLAYLQTAGAADEPDVRQPTLSHGEEVVMALNRFTQAARNDTRIVRLIGGLLAVVGLAALTGGGALWVSNYLFEARARMTDGVVVDLDRHDYESSSGGRHSPGKTETRYRAAVRFRTQEGHEVDFTDGYASSQPSHARGQMVKVRYDPANPGRAEIAGLTDHDTDVAILSELGAVLSLLGVGALYLARRDRRKDEWFDKHAVWVEAIFAGVAVHSVATSSEAPASTLLGENNPWRLKASWQDPKTGTYWLFLSEAIWFDPAPYVVDRGTLSVQVVPDDPTQHRVDISFLPKKDPFLYYYGFVGRRKRGSSAR
jgi:hypothetical protein